MDRAPAHDNPYRQRIATKLFCIIALRILDRPGNSDWYCYRARVVVGSEYIKARDLGRVIGPGPADPWSAAVSDHTTIEGHGNLDFIIVKAGSMST